MKSDPTKTAEVISITLPKKLKDVISFLRVALEKIPAEFQEDATFHIEIIEDSYWPNEAYRMPRAYVNYIRPRTPQELFDLGQEEGRILMEIRDREIKQLRELKKKYPGEA